MPDPRTAEERLHEDEYDALARQLHESIAEGQSVSLTAKALRILAAPDRRALFEAGRATGTVEGWADYTDAALAAEPVPAPLDATCAVCGNVIVKDAHGGRHPSAGDHDPAPHVARAYGTQPEPEG